MPAGKREIKSNLTWFNKAIPVEVGITMPLADRNARLGSNAQDMTHQTDIKPNQKLRRTFFVQSVFILVLVMVFFSALFIAPGAKAQQGSAVTPADVESTSFTVAGFSVEGKNPLGKSTTDKILNSYTNRELTIEGLREAATALEKELALKGYNFYRATVPPQELNDDVVRLKIERIDIANVAVSGNQYFSDNNIARSLPLVSSGRSPNTQKIASALLLAEDNPAKEVRVVFIKGDTPQTVDANIAITDQNPNEIFLWANNAGSRQTTSSRLGVQYHNRNMWGMDHQMALSFTTSPEEPDELKQFGVNYRLPLYRLRGMANVFVSRSDADTGIVADVFDISGAGETVGIGYKQYLEKRGNYQHRLSVGITDKLFDSDILFRSTEIGNDVRSRPLLLEYISRYDKDNWLLNSIVTHATNLSGGSFNDDASYANVRAGADTDWSKQELSLRFDYRISQVWNSRLMMFAQTSSDSLIPGEQFGMGGALGDLGPRGFYEREVTVDEGVKASLEFSRNFPTKRMRIGVFYDYASGDRNNPQVGEAAKETLSSAGINYKWNIRSDVSLDLSYGYVIDGIDQTFSNGTDDGDSRLHLSVRYFPKWPWGNK